MKRLFRPLKSAIGKRLDGESKTLFKNSSWVFIANLNATVLDFIRSVILGRGLGVENFGLYILITTLVKTIQEFFNLNVGTALIKFGADYKSSNNIEKLVALLKLSLVLAGISAVISVLFIMAFSHLAYDMFLTRPGLRLYIQFYAVAASVSFFDYISISFLKLYLKFRLNSVVKILLDTLELGIIAATIYLFPGQLEILIVSAVSALLVKGLVYNGVAFWELRDVILPNLGARMSSLRDDSRSIRSFIINNSASRTIHTLIYNGDVLLLGALAGPVQVGYYSIAKKLAFALQRATDPLSYSIYPQLAHLVAVRNYRDARVMLTRISKILAVPLMLALVIFSFISEWMITLIYGIDYQAGTLPFVILLVAGVVSTLLFWSTPIIFSLGRVDIRLKAYLAALALGLSLGYPLGLHYGATGISIALCVSIIFIHAVFLRVAIKELR
jgi:O-antigen/teichoic acid export membrane protein